jgi:hypothetical protein
MSLTRALGLARHVTWWAEGLVGVSEVGQGSPPESNEDESLTR